MEEGKLPKAVHNWRIARKNRQRLSLPIWDHNRTKSMEKFRLTAGDIKYRDL